MIWNLDFHRLIQLLEWLGMEISGRDFFSKFDVCRLVVNVYKHGNGVAHRELSSMFPEYYYRFKTEDSPRFAPRHEYLTVTEAQFVEFADAIAAFWINTPERSLSSQLRETPKWLESEIKNQEKRLAKLNSRAP